MYKSCGRLCLIFVDFLELGRYTHRSIFFKSTLGVRSGAVYHNCRRCHRRQNYTFLCTRPPSRSLRRRRHQIVDRQRGRQRKRMRKEQGRWGCRGDSPTREGSRWSRRSRIFGRSSAWLTENLKSNLDVANSSIGKL